jgi:glycerate kinase
MSVLIAVDKFKGSLTQVEVSQVVEQALINKGLDSKVIVIADGGDGSIMALEKIGWQLLKVGVTGPVDQQHIAKYAVSPDGKKVALEVAELCGIKLLEGGLAPFQASSHALGEAIIKIKPSEYEELLIFIGGSASVDGGVGALSALGVGLYDAKGLKISPNLSGLMRLKAINSKQLAQIQQNIFQNCKITVLSDTNYRLLGFKGAAMAFGKQKGLGWIDRIRAELALRRFARLISRFNHGKPERTPGSAGAGGIGFAFYSFFAASIESGSNYFYKETDFVNELKDASLLITGEGRIDETTTSGKSIYPLLTAARASQIKCLLICGSADAHTVKGLKKEFPTIVDILQLKDTGLPIKVLMKDAAELLRRELDKIPIERWIK